MSDPITRLNAALEGRYSIERELGQGGMATVYLADDLKHERKVALKVLKPELAAVVGAERFLAEIKTTAALQHPNILPLHDSGEADSFLFYVMPFVEGESLRDRLDREHQLPVKDAVEIARGLADALEYAHGKGVIHRDIKSANILLQAGKPVIADFGIALAVGVAGGGRLTETGLSVGTPHYMSPEQATGDQSVGAATDIYALGCVLHELLVGEPPYTGATAQAILGKILAGELASATKQRASVPAHVDATIRKSLEKLPADRFRSALDFAKALGDPSYRYGAESTPGGGATGERWRRRTWLGWGAAAVLAVAFGWSLMTRYGEAPQAASRFVIPFETGQGFVPGTYGVEFDISPDGRSIAYVGPGAVGGTQIWIRALDDLEPRPIPGTQDASLPRYSPGGDALVFWLANGYSSIALPSGSPSRLLDGAIRELTWGFDGWLYFPRDRGIARIPETGGEPEMVVDAPEEGDYRVPNALPGGRSMIATHRTGPTSRLVAISLETGAVSDLVEGSMARHTSSGHLVYVRGDGTLFAAPFDEDAAELGPSVEVLAGVEVDGQESSGQFAISQSGTLLYRSGPSRSGLYNLVWVDRDGAVERVDPNWSFDGSSPLSAGADEIGLAISPDGTRVALKTHSDDGEDIWVRDLDTGSMLRLTRDEGVDRRPRWSTDGERVVFHSDRGGNRDLWEIPADGTGAPRLLLDLDRPILEVQLSPEWFILRLGGMAGVVGDRDIVGVRRGDTTVVPLAAEPFDEKAMALSPDGRWLAYESTETGTEEIYVRPFPDVEGGKFPVSLEGGGAPRWSVSGDELFFVSRDRQMMAAEILTDGAAFRVGQRLPLFDVDELSINIDVTWATYDLAADGRFLMHQFDIAEEVPRRLVIVENWLEEMKERVEGNR